MIKIWRLASAKRGARARGNDLVVFDAPATGHALGMLRSPETFSRIARVGPIVRDTGHVRELLCRPGADRLPRASRTAPRWRSPRRSSCSRDSSRRPGASSTPSSSTRCCRAASARRSSSVSTRCPRTVAAVRSRLPRALRTRSTPGASYQHGAGGPPATPRLSRARAARSSGRRRWTSTRSSCSSRGLRRGWSASPSRAERPPSAHPAGASRTRSANPSKSKKISRCPAGRAGRRPRASRGAPAPTGRGARGRRGRLRSPCARRSRSPLIIDPPAPIRIPF